MKTILYNPIFINPQAYYVFPRLTRWLRPDDSYKEPANYIGQIEVTIIAYGEIGYTEYFEHTNYIDFTNFSNSYVRISLFTRLGACVLGEWKIGTMEGDRPYIEPEVLASLKAVVIVGDKTNQDKDRDIVANLVDASNPFIISNAAYKLNSGYGLYGMDFLDWKSNSGMNFTSTKLTSTKPNLSGGWLTFRNVSGLIPETKVKVSGAPREFGFIANNNGTDDKFSVTINNGVYTIPEFTLSSASGFYINNNSGDWSNLVIEQIPSYQGAFVTDGIDDLITSTKTVQEMLGGSNELTIVSMVHQVKDSTNNVSFTNYIRGSANGYFRNIVNNYDKTGIYGYTSSDLKGLSVVNNILGDKNDYTSNGDNRDSIINGNFSVQGYSYNDGNNTGDFSSVAWYWTIIANKVLTTDQINQVIAYYNLDRCVEPTVLYDVKKQGLSNDTPDSDWYLKDYSGNGYDMTLYNYAKTPESGINEDGGLQSDGVDDYGKVTGLPIYKDYTVVADYVRTFAKENVRDAPILSKSQVAGDGAFLFNYLNVNSVISSYSFGTNNVLTNVSDSERKIYYQSKYVNGGKSINSGTGTDYDSMWLGTYRDDGQIFFTGAIYSLMTFPYSMSEFLIERQLKKHKLGTLYPDMVEFRPIVNSNVEWNIIEIWQADKPLYRPAIGTNETGTYLQKDSTIGIYVKPKGVDEVTKIVVNGTEYTNLKINSDGFYYVTLPITTSSQKIDITIDEYIRYEDIVQPYPDMIDLRQDNKTITWGDKLKVGSEIIYYNDYNSNPLSKLYNLGTVLYNGNYIYGGNIIEVKKDMVFTSKSKWKLDNNEPKCILSPSRLRIPNSSYKILGYIPDISGHGNHGKINNSAYAEGSGVNADGSYQLDGVDDFITIPTLSSGGKQVLMKVNLGKQASMLYDQRTGNNSSFAIYALDVANYVAYNRFVRNGNTYLDGILNQNILCEELKGITHNIVCTNGESPNKSPIIGSNFEYTQDFAQMSLYDFMLFDEISTDEEILTLNEYVGIEGNTDDLFN